MKTTSEKIKSWDKMIFAYDDSKKIIGHIRILCKKGFHHKWASEAEITGLWVEENYRKQGIASSLIEKGIAYAKSKNISRIALYVYNEENALFDFYKKRGFERTCYTELVFKP